MKTPKEYVVNLNNKIITKQMLGDCLYSVNKRAKNYRDRLNRYRSIREECRYFHRYYGCEGYEFSCEESMKKMYDKKDKLLRLVKPQCIHHTNYDKYFLFYEFGDYSFHSPIDEYDLEYYHLDIKEIGSLETYGHNIDNLISCQFIDKMLKLIESKEYSYAG